MLYNENNNFIKRIYNKLTLHIDYIIYKSIIYSRLYRFYKQNNNIFMSFLYGRKFYKFSSKYNLEIYGDLGNNVRIYHGNVVINTNSKIGNDVSFHGNNCIGNNGYSDEAPIIGDNVDIGYGAVIIGGIKIANGIIIGANSVVTKSFDEENIVVAGNPAKKLDSHLKNK